MTGTIRPYYHFTPPQNFMNDPNGLVYHDGEYHLFYQHNPYGDLWGHMSWGHAVSRDLVNWQHLPIALYEQEEMMIFSGSAVVDWQNSSGFGLAGEPPLIAIFTAHSPDKQTQNLAYSLDNGRSWQMNPDNPLIDIGSTEFRDPKVFWYAPARQWIMLTVLADQHKVRFDGSPDLKHWTHLSDFGPAGAVKGLWECPDLFPLSVEQQPDRTLWVLKVDEQFGIGAQYFIGTFDGNRFINSAPEANVSKVDYGADFYAAQSWSDLPEGRRVWLGWVNNWSYAFFTPTSPWRGMLSIPRQLVLREYPDGLHLIQQPVPELERLRKIVFAGADLDCAAATAQLSGAKLISGLEIIADFVPGNAEEVGIEVRSTAGDVTLIGYRVQTNELFLDRTNAGKSDFSPLFPGIHRAPLSLENGKISLHVFIDTCSVEVFANRGRVVISDLIFPKSQDISLEFYSRGGKARLDQLDVWSLKGN